MAQKTTDKIDWTRIDTPLKFEGKEIVLPGTPQKMPIPAAIKTLTRIKEQEDQKFDTKELVKGAPWDALVAVYRAMQDIYGVVLSESIQTFFGEIKPDMISVMVGPKPNDKIMVPAGQMSLPGVDDPFMVHLHPMGCYIMGTVKKVDQARLVEIANKARWFLENESIYKGKAIELQVDSDGDLNLNVQPRFVDLSRVTEDDMVHTRETDSLIRTNIFAPLKNTEACRRHRVPLKRGILLEGRYGTGKTLTARCTARVAVDNGWTMVMLDRAIGLKAALEFARSYQPCVIFAEDIDRVAEDRGEESVNDLVNLMDGILTKDSEIMTVLTTNFVEKIDRALLRPGRFDAVISIQPPDAETASRIVRSYAGDLLADDADLSKTGELLSGQIPAMIAEIVKRAKLSMLMEDRSHISASDLETAAVQMKRHMGLLEPPSNQKTPRDLLWEGMRGLLEGEAADGDEDGVKGDMLLAQITSVKGRVQSGIGKLLEELQGVSQRASAAATNSAKTLDAVRNMKKNGAEA